MKCPWDNIRTLISPHVEVMLYSSRCVAPARHHLSSSRTGRCRLQLLGKAHVHMVFNKSKPEQEVHSWVWKDDETGVSANLPCWERYWDFPSQAGAAVAECSLSGCAWWEESEPLNTCVSCWELAGSLQRTAKVTNTTAMWMARRWGGPGSVMLFSSVLYFSV